MAKPAQAMASATRMRLRVASSCPKLLEGPPWRRPARRRGEGTSAAAPRKGAPPRRRGLLALLLGLLGRHVGLLDDLRHLAEHDGGVAVEEGDAGEALAILEGVDDERLLRAEDDLGHLVRLERVGRLHLLAAGLLANLEVEAGDLAGRAAATHEANGGVAQLDFARDVQGGSA